MFYRGGVTMDTYLAASLAGEDILLHGTIQIVLHGYSGSVEGVSTAAVEWTSGEATVVGAEAGDGDSREAAVDGDRRKT